MYSSFIFDQTILVKGQSENNIFGHVSCTFTGFFSFFFYEKWKIVVEPVLPNIQC